MKDGRGFGDGEQRGDQQWLGDGCRWGDEHLGDPGGEVLEQVYGWTLFHVLESRRRRRTGCRGVRSQGRIAGTRKQFGIGYGTLGCFQQNQWKGTWL